MKLLVRLFVGFCLMSFVTTQSFAQLPAPSGPSLTVDELQRAYPNATLLQVSPAEFARINDEFTRTTAAMLVIAQDMPTDTNGSRTTPTCPEGQVLQTKPSDAGAPAQTVCVDAKSADINATKCPPGQVPVLRKIAGDEKFIVVCETPPAPHSGPDLNLNLIGQHSGGGHGGGGKDAAAIFFVVIGVVVVAMLVVYAGKYVRDAVVNHEQQTYWYDYGAQVTLISGSGGDGGALTGLKFSGGVVEEGVRIGLAGELGYLDQTLTSSATNGTTTHVHGAYGMVGPAIRWPLGAEDNPSYAYLELIAGTANHRDVGVMSNARVGVNLNANAGWRFGFNLGAMYTDLKTTQGLLQRDKYSFVYGLDVGYRLR